MKFILNHFFYRITKERPELYVARFGLIRINGIKKSHHLRKNELGEGNSTRAL
ncbi:hypothetical protein J7M23_00280 [Candidatus Sumerlaeota bacterium]|nr:hypothetical protein [Candidatus Sumerlaeota bacterium]